MVNEVPWTHRKPNPLYHVKYKSGTGVSLSASYYASELDDFEKRLKKDGGKILSKTRVDADD